MKIVYFYQYFCTPNGSWGTRIYEFASEWVAQGHDVTVVTSLYSKSDLKATKFIETQYHNGIRVKVINLKIDNRQPLLQRIYTFVAYAIISAWYALTLPADVVVASSGPITVGIPGLVARYLRGRKLVFEARDLWPDGAIELGIIKNPLIRKLAYGFESFCYASSRAVVSLSPGMKEAIERKHKHPQVYSVTNSANISLFSGILPFKDYSVLRSGKYAIYSGNIGEVNNAWWMYEAARSLREKGHGDIVILMVGEGQQKKDLQARVAKDRLENLIFFDLMPKTELVALVQHAMVSLVPLKGTPVLDTSSPNKFFESLAAGVPVIQTTQGWMKVFLDAHDIGFTVDPNDPTSLADCLIALDANKALKDELGRNAAIVAREHFDKSKLAADMLAALQKAIR